MSAIIKKETVSYLPPPSDSDCEEAISAAFHAESAWGEATKQCFKNYRRAGELLTARKNSLEHGQWEAWLKRHRPSRYQGAWLGNDDAWARTARNWMRISHILAHCHAAVIESAQTVAQLFRLAQMLPEGGGAPDAIGGHELAPAAIVSRVHRWVTSSTPILDAQRIQSWSPQERQRLREELRPVVELFESLDE